MKHKTVRGVLVAAGVAAAAAFAWTGASPAHAEPECLTGSNDFDRDGLVDDVVGMPGAKSGAGAVEVRLTNEGDGKILRVEAPGAKAGDRFGAAVGETASYQNEGDDAQCSQLVVGAPGRDVDGKNDAGAVFVLKYDLTTQQFTLVKELAQGKGGVPGTAQAGAKFGSAVASRYNEAGQIDPVPSRLYVGAPGTDVGSASDAGAFATFKVQSDGTAVEGTQVTQGAGGVPGTAEAGDVFGSSLAAVSNGVLAGAPGENSKAGGFVHRIDSTGKSVFITQNTGDVPGTSEAGDEYGAALYAAPETKIQDGSYMVLVGAPGEAIGSLNAAGSVQIFRFNASVATTGVKGYNQDTSGVAGNAEAGDRFGAALGTYGELDPLVGVPGEDIGTLKDGGSVSGLRGDRAWTQDTAGMPGAVEAGDKFGATIGNAHVDFSGENAFWFGAPLVGATGENSGAGSVTVGLSVSGSTQQGWVQQNAQAGDGYGTALGKTN